MRVLPNLSRARHGALDADRRWRAIHLEIKCMNDEKGKYECVAVRPGSAHSIRDRGRLLRLQGHGEPIAFHLVISPEVMGTRSEV